MTGEYDSVSSGVENCSPEDFPERFVGHLCESLSEALMAEPKDGKRAIQINVEIDEQFRNRFPDLVKISFTFKSGMSLPE